MNSIPAHSGSVAAPRLLHQVRGNIRRKHHSLHVEQAYVDSIRRFIRHFGKRHPRDIGTAEVEAFLAHPAVVGRVAASTQNQARSALLLLHREVLGAELPWFDSIEQTKVPRRLPVALARHGTGCVRLAHVFATE